MELFAPILGMTMIVAGLILLVVGVSWLLYLLWQSGKTPAAQPDASLSPDSGLELEGVQS